MFDVKVFRQNGSIPGTYSWYVTFPSFLGDLPLLVANGAGLTGKSTRLTVSEVVRGKIPTIQRILATGSSELSGYFYVRFLNSSTLQLPYNIDERNLQEELSRLPGIGDIVVSRNLLYSNPTSLEKNVTTSTYIKELSNYQNHLDVTDTVGENVFVSYEWKVTFLSGGNIPLMEVCCSQMQVLAFEADEVTLRSSVSLDSSLIVELSRQNILPDGRYKTVASGTTFNGFSPVDVLKLSLQEFPPIFVSIHANNADLLDIFRFYGIFVKDVNVSTGIGVKWDIRRTLGYGQLDKISAISLSENVAVTHQIITIGSQPLKGYFDLHDSEVNSSQRFYVTETIETLTNKLSTLNAALFSTASLSIERYSPQSGGFIFNHADVANKRYQFNFLIQFC